MGQIKIVGLGPGAAGHLSLETLELLKSDAQIILRTAVHPTVAELVKQKINFTACDDLYERGASFEEVYAGVVERVINAAQVGDVVYAVPGSPLVAERTVVLLREQAQKNNLALSIRPSMSFLDLAYVDLGIDPIAGLRIIDAQDLEAVSDAGSYPMIITQVYSRLVAGDLKLALMDELDDDYQIYFLRRLGLEDAECRAIKLFELDRQESIDYLTSIYVPALGAAPCVREPGCEQAVPEENYVTTTAFDDADIQPLVDVMRTLREPGGCPWDREQTHASIRSNMIEEVYEYLEAVDDEDLDGMREELGDVLMQVVFHARMAEEAGHFDLQDIIDEVVDKLIRRHPHVFGDTHVTGSDEVLVNWEAIKKTEKTERKRVLDGVTPGLPALLRAYKIQGKVAKVGFDWQDIESVWEKIEEELGEVRDAVALGDACAIENEIGDLLFAIVNYARHKGVEPETALNGTNNRFVKRFEHVEDCVLASGKNWNEFTLDELDKFWDEAKQAERSKK